MKKRIALLALAALALFALAGCRAGAETEGQIGPAIDPAVPEDSKNPDVSGDVEPPAVSQPAGTDDIPEDCPPARPVTARVKLLPNDWGLLLVTDWEGTEYFVGLCDVYEQNAQTTGADGGAITVDELRPGMILDITWNGIIAESYPGIFTADEVRVVEQGDNLVGMYRQILAELWAETGQKTGVERLSFDFSGLTDLSAAEQTALAYLTACKLEMGFSYSSGTWDELVSDNCITMDGDGYWTDGMLLSLFLYEQEDGHAGIIASSHRSRDGAILVLTCIADRQEDGSWSYETFSPSGT